jgi:hypothetical protein
VARSSDTRAHAAKRRYLETIDELAAAKQALSDEASLVAWLDSGSGAEAANDQLGGPPIHADGRATVSFSAVLEGAPPRR